MALYIKKFGGTSVGSLERIHAVADQICAAREQGQQVVAVVSAMSGETDRLLSLAYTIQAQPKPRELAALITLGEQITTNLLVMALAERGCLARSMTGAQSGIVTDNAYLSARIEQINPEAMQVSLARNEVPVVAGFQGQTWEGDVTALGRGGSDTTAVALAAALKAKECQIYTDVAGVYTADPRLVPHAYLLEKIDLASMLELASLGAKVLQRRSVELAGKYQVPLRILSSFHEGAGTLVDYAKTTFESAVFSGLAHQVGLCKFICQPVKNPQDLSDLLTLLSEKHVHLEAVSNFNGQGYQQAEIIIHRDDRNRCQALIEDFCRERSMALIWQDGLARLALVGIGLRSYSWVMQRFLAVLAQHQISYSDICSTEISLAVLMPEHQLAITAQVLHQAFFEG